VVDIFGYARDIKEGYGYLFIFIFIFEIYF